MIPFFRKIRKKMADDNRPLKYMRYAIGEIILVVIGILIALQINNWNQNRLDRNFEVTMLKEIRSSLESDLKSFKSFESRQETKRQGIQKLLAMISSNQTYPDTTLLNAYNEMRFGNLFTYNKGGYEGVKSVGLNKITNDSVRKELILLYEVRIPEIMSLYDFFVQERSTNKDYELELHNALWKRIKIQMPDKSYKIVSRPINNEEFLKRPELIDRIKIEQDKLNYINFAMNMLKFRIEKGLEIINAELNKE